VDMCCIGLFFSVARRVAVFVPSTDPHTQIPCYAYSLTGRWCSGVSGAKDAGVGAGRGLGRADFP